MYTKKHGCNIGGRKSRLDTLRSRISGDTSKTIDRVQCIDQHLTNEAKDIMARPFHCKKLYNAMHAIAFYVDHI